MGGAAMGGAFAPGTIALSNLTTIIGSFFGHIGIIGGLIIGGVIAGFVNWLRKDRKYKDALDQTKNKIESSFLSNEEWILKDFEIFRQDLKIVLDKKFEILLKNIDFNKEELEKIKKEYNKLKDKAIKKLQPIKK